MDSTSLSRAYAFERVRRSPGRTRPFQFRAVRDARRRLGHQARVPRRAGLGDRWRYTRSRGVAGNVLTLLNIQLSGKKCRVFTSDLRIRVAATGLGTYPDVSVVCGHIELDPEDAKACPLRLSRSARSAAAARSPSPARAHLSPSTRSRACEPTRICYVAGSRARLPNGVTNRRGPKRFGQTDGTSLESMMRRSLVTSFAPSTRAVATIIRSAGSHARVTVRDDTSRAIVGVIPMR